MKPKVGVTAYCLAFNHADYIGKTLQGFLDQKTDFPFHVIIHDDASTDNTRAVIEEYVARRPELFTTVFQKENQYSQRADIIGQFIDPLIQTEYVCICEGDDYWTDPNKLQLQFDYMQQHPQCSMCVHNTEKIAFDETPLNALFSECMEDRDYTADEVIALGSSTLFHTSSFMFRQEVMKNKPSCYDVPEVGDYPIAIYMATQGPIHYIARTMSRYRTNVPGSWSARVQNNYQKSVVHWGQMVDMLTKVDNYTGGQYHKAFQTAIERYQYNLYIARNQLLPIFKHPQYRRQFAANRTPYKAKLVLRWFVKPFVKWFRN